ncbi:MAG: response regulator [Methanosarcinales archaeon]|nr:response regulator [Methanosarcinales archaeon]
MKKVMTGIPGMDEIFRGGFVRPSTMLVNGTAGSGKTTFCMQSLFNAVRDADETCLYMPVFNEPIAVVNSFMLNYKFYDTSFYETGKMHFFGLGDAAATSPSTIISEIQRQMELISPDRVVIDSLNSLAYRMDEVTKREFLYDLLNAMKGWNALILLTGEFRREDVFLNVESYLVDGIIHIDKKIAGEDRIPFVEVLKGRGAAFIRGEHTFKMDDDGIRVYPRPKIENSDKEVVEAVKRLKTGIEGLDTMLHGGLLENRSVIVAGGSGTGKTMFGLQFLYEGAKNDEMGMFISFRETPQEIIENSRSYGLDIQTMVDKGLITLVLTSPVEFSFDEFFYLLEDTIKGHNIKRLLIDGVTNLETPYADNVQIRNNIQELSSMLKKNDITVVLSSGQEIVTSDMQVTSHEINQIVDTVISLRYAEIESSMKKALAIIKMRGSLYDTNIREYIITSKGIEVLSEFSGYEGVFGGSIRKKPAERRIRILAVDDEPDILTIIKDSFMTKPYDVITATNGQEALDMVFREAPDCILLDVMMPNMDGYQVMELLKTRKSTQNIPIIMLTAKIDIEDKLKAIEMGADDYITKPFDPRELAARIRMVTRRGWDN